jgi:hypothetical protein
VAKAVRVEGAQLKPAQQMALGALAGADATDLTRARYQEITGVSRSQAAYDLAELVDAGILVRTGAGRATRYRLAPAAHSGRRRWTNNRIHAELSAFCSGWTTWPSAAEFKRAGRSDLYVAASRYGGIGFWAAELGFSRSERSRAEARRWMPFRLRSKQAFAAVLVFALGAGAVGLALRMHQHDGVPTPPLKAKAIAHQAAAPADDVRWLRLARVAGLSAQAAAARTRAGLVLRASRGDSWIAVRSATGRLLYERTLTRGTQVRLKGTTLWIRLGAARNVDLSANGERSHPLPERAAVVVVTPRGLRVTEWVAQQSAPQLVASQAAPPSSPATPPRPAPSPAPSAVKAVPAPAAAAKLPENRAASGSSWPAPLPPP